ncbi:MAG TPA: Rieske (2Fe-2S) protein [Nocardioidaceae bacterium]|jgi:nitrite reductase/ring-hydroxylating ferredoxin subunit|nr:Rieske (2Fe-2S) protein [Nocardioidaceae bacterium]
MTHEDERSSDLTRRTMLRGATVGGIALPLLAACGGGDTSSSASGDSSSESDPSPSSTASAGDGGGAAGISVSASDVPVGGGTVLEKDKVVVVQPTKGAFKAYTAVCTHQGCTVGKVEGGQIICPCHGSHFSIKDGNPVAGPAQKPLAAKTVTVKGSEISVS